MERVAISWGVEQIGESAFHFCDALANIHIPASVTIIGKLAFAECRSLSEISIPGSVETLGDYAFGDCDSLERLLVDEGMLVIGHGAFTNCRSLTNIWISESLRCNVEGAFEPHVLQHVTLFRDGNRGFMQRPFRIRNYCDPDPFHPVRFMDSTSLNSSFVGFNQFAVMEPHGLFCAAECLPWGDSDVRASMSWSLR